MSHRAEIDRLLASPPPDWKRQWRNAREQLRALGHKAPALPDASKALMALSLTAGGRVSGDRVVGTVPVPAAVRDEAMRAIRMAHRFNYGAWNFIGLARAIQLATIPRIDARSVERMRGFFTRHAKDAEAAGFGNDERPSRGYLAHLVWGGDPAKEWVMGMEQRVRRNPLAQPSATMAFSFRKDAIPGVVEVYLYEPEELDDPARSLVGGAMLTLAAGGRWETQGMAACPGYGPLVYDLAASVLQARIHATGDQTEAAKRFWARQGKRYIDPMKPEAFAKKYGVTPKELFLRGYELTPDDYRRMGDELSTVFWGAKEAEKKGKPLALLRCAVPNGRGRR